MSGVTTQNLARFYDNFAMVMAMEPKTLIVHGLEVAVERNAAGTDINTAASAWVTKGYLTQADADAIAALVTARDTPPEEPEPEEPEPTEPTEGGE